MGAKTHISAQVRSSCNNSGFSIDIDLSRSMHQSDLSEYQHDGLDHPNR